ncbi:MAG: hypothetical protein ACUZ8I_07770 [Candidatus Scalindua sp.]
MEEGKVVSEEEKGLNLQEEENSKDGGHREELVEISDIALVLKMNKEDLQEYAITRLNTDLNLNDRIKLLRVRVVHLINGQLKGNAEDIKPVEKAKSGPQKASNKPEFIFNPANRRIFEWTETLGQRVDYVPCFVVDLNGNRL